MTKSSCAARIGATSSAMPLRIVGAVAVDEDDDVGAFGGDARRRAGRRGRSRGRRR